MPSDSSTDPRDSPRDSPSESADQADRFVAALRRALHAHDLLQLAQLWQKLPASSPQTLRASAALFEQHGLYERAAILRERAGELRQAQVLWQQAGLFTESGRVAEQLGDEQAAEALYREAADAGLTRSVPELPEPGEPHDLHVPERGAELRLGLLLFRQGRTTEALPPLQAARRQQLSQAVPDGTILDELEPVIASGLVQHGLAEAALPLLESFRRRHPDAPPAVTDWLAPKPSEPREPPKLLLGRYRLQKLLGAGGMGRVFLAEDVVTMQPVALKLLPLTSALGDSSPHWQRFCAEAQILRALHHPQIVAIHDFSAAAGILVMEYLRGGSLGDQPLPLSLGKTQRILLDVTAGLLAAHGASVLHRDLKPHNLFLDPAHNTKIGDFGAALLAQLGATQTESLVGTLAYMSPEQLSGQPLTFASDLYSLGVTLFQLLTGRLPFVGPDWASQHLSQPPPDARELRPQLPAPWAELCQQLLAKRPQDRPPSLEALLEQARRLPVPMPGALDDETVRPAQLRLGSLPAADEALRPAIETAPERSEPPRGQTLIGQTNHSELFHFIDARLARGLHVERFSVEHFQSAQGQRHLHWLRTMARLGGPGLQRVLRIVLDGPQPEVHYEEPIGRQPSKDLRLDARAGMLLQKTLAAIHSAGEVHGTVADSILIERYGPLLLLSGRGPLSWPAGERLPDPQTDQLALAALLEPKT